MKCRAIALLLVSACTPSVEVRHPGGKLPRGYPHGPVAPRGLHVELQKRCEGPGIAWLKMTIGVDGRPVGIVVADASEEPFGKMCVSMLQDAGAWRPARDAAGQPVAHEIKYQCECSDCETVFCGSVQTP